ncbi:unnamed protein product [Cyprideis torosa]|uniref:Uncharacterized protein n=1 Tax=Cyprideis torosa TaxID=163714 RepID=A0A7R8ZKQ2_9CRUS|nr:unnamed protein product [Cyprideis torosa]CAG0889896.1 unnamed protein product [Cyprideis torosa]
MPATVLSSVTNVCLSQGFWELRHTEKRRQFGLSQPGSHEADRMSDNIYFKYGIPHLDLSAHEHFQNIIEQVVDEFQLDDDGEHSNLFEGHVKPMEAGRDGAPENLLHQIVEQDSMDLQEQKIAMENTQPEDLGDVIQKITQENEERAAKKMMSAPLYCCKNERPELFLETNAVETPTIHAPSLSTINFSNSDEEDSTQSSQRHCRNAVTVSRLDFGCGERAWQKMSEQDFESNASSLPSSTEDTNAVDEEESTMTLLYEETDTSDQFSLVERNTFKIHHIHHIRSTSLLSIEELPPAIFNPQHDPHGYNRVCHAVLLEQEDNFLPPTPRIHEALNSSQEDFLEISAVHPRDILYDDESMDNSLIEASPSSPGRRHSRVQIPGFMSTASTTSDDDLLHGCSDNIITSPVRQPPPPRNPHLTLASLNAKERFGTSIADELRSMEVSHSPAKKEYRQALMTVTPTPSKDQQQLASPKNLVSEMNKKEKKREAKEIAEARNKCSHEAELEKSSSYGLSVTLTAAAKSSAETRPVLPSKIGSLRKKIEKRRRRSSIERSSSTSQAPDGKCTVSSAAYNFGVPPLFHNAGRTEEKTNATREAEDGLSRRQKAWRWWKGFSKRHCGCRWFDKLVTPMVAGFSKSGTTERPP